MHQGIFVGVQLMSKTEKDSILLACIKTQTGRGFTEMHLRDNNCTTVQTVVHALHARAGC